MSAHEQFQAGNLPQAIAASIDEVRNNPSDINRRGFLAELYCFAGEIEKADKQLDLIAMQNPEAAVGVALFRQLLRAATAREQCFTEGRLPEFIGEPTAEMKLHLEALIRLRENQRAEAVQLLSQAEAARPHLGGTCNGTAFDDFRDLDDITSSFFEVLTSTGKYFWIPFQRIELVEFRQPSRPRDLLWQRAHMVVSEGPDGEVYLPTLYVDTHKETKDNLRFGRETDWHDGPPVRGRGQRTFLVGEEGKGIMELKELKFNIG
jgi:type VI secretion system protein ImpE